MGSSSSKSGGYIGSPVIRDQDAMNTEQKGEVYIYSTTFGWFLEHHSIVVDAVSGYWHIYEWSDGDGIKPYWKNLRMYQTNRISGKKVKFLGYHKLSEVYNAAVNSSRGESYSVSSYNCNHWVEQVASRLGYDVSVGCLLK